MTQNIKAIQNFCTQRGIDALIIFTSDDHGSEYVVDHYKARAYFSGFTGSAGTMIVTPTQANVWTDGRYFLQAAEQLATTGVGLMKMGEAGVPTVNEYLKALGTSPCVAFDFACATVSFVQALKAELPNVRLLDTDEIVNELWSDRPEVPKTKAWQLSQKVAGESVRERLTALRADTQKEGCAYAVVSALDDVAWLFNLRGDDILYNPVNYAYAIVGQESAVLYIEREKLNDKMVEEFAADGIEIRPYAQVYADAQALCGKVLIDAAKTNYALYNAIADKKEADVFPTTARKAIKNAVEIAGSKKAHIQDGVAMVRFMHYLKTHVGKEEMTEISLADTLEAFRRQSKHFIELSFDTICGYRAHGAIVHYSATPQTDVPVYAEGLLLVDSGAQYDTGTTDITRTFALGKLTKKMKHDYTLVLQSHIDLAMAVFPQGLPGYAVDMLAREPLYKECLDYRHGTGHGVGHVLNVHEGPQSIAMRKAKSTMTALKAGMITSNEPGLYVTGEYGIRHENLVLCVEKGNSEYGTFLGFEPLTFVPFDLDAIDATMLSVAQKAWLNAYHKQVYKKLAKYFSGKELAFLQRATRAI